MANIDELSIELKKYTKIYNDILVGMHNDINSYKKDVVEQKLRTNYVSKIIENNLNEISQLKTETDADLKKIANVSKLVTESETNIQAKIEKFEIEKKSIANDIVSIKEELSFALKTSNNKLNTLSESLVLIQNDFKEAVDTNSKKINKELALINKKRKQKSNVIFFTIVVIFISIGYLYYKLL